MPYNAPPGLAGYLAQENNLRQQQAGQVGQLSQMLQIQGELQKQRQEQSFRADLSAADTQEKQLAVAVKYGGPSAIMSHADRQQRSKDTQEATMARLSQQAQQFEANWQLRYQGAKTQEERLNLERYREAFKQSLQSEAQRLAGAKGAYDFGFTPAPAIAPTVSGAPATAAPAADPLAGRPQNEIDAIRMIQGANAAGQHLSVGVSPGQAPQVMGGAPMATPAPAASAMPTDQNVPSAVPTTPATMSMGASGGLGGRFPPAGQAAPSGPVPAAAVVAPTPNTPQMPQFTGSPRQIAIDTNKWMMEQAKNGTAGRPSGDFTKTGTEFLASLPETDRKLVEKIAHYDIDPKTLSTKGGHREKVLSLVAQYDPTYDDTQYANKRRAITQFGSGPQGNTVRSLNVAIEHIDTLKRAADAMKNGEFTPGNKAYNELAKVFGQTPPNTFEGIRDIVANEVVKGTIGGSGALEDRKGAAEKVLASKSPQQLNELMNGWVELMGGQVKGLERQYESSTRNKDFRERYLTQRARDAIGLAEQKAGTPSFDADKERRYQEWKSRQQK